ncbi:MAG: phytoene desaturase, partial [Actinobacteria bacterium]|nr:phytoene desaturase [Actinomycetota bacterium]
MVARVKGPTDHVVIVGAGLAGLSAALRLAGAGRKVTVLERESVPGGRNGLLNKDGYSFDTGPTVLTMPSLINDAFNCVGEDMKDWLELTPLTPLYRAFYADGSQLDVHSDTAEMEAEIAQHISGAEAAGYRKYVDFVTKLYKYEMNDFIDRNIDSPFNLLTPNLARLIALGGFRKLSPKVNQFMKDPRLQKVYSFQAMYAGVSPQQALAIYAVIAYMDSVNGVFFPKGGMHAVPRALAAAAQKHGVVFKYNTTVSQVEVTNGRAKAVITEAGERYECDAVILNPDLPVAYRDLLGKTPLSVKRLKYSPSCVTLLIGSNKKYDHTAHHNIHFGHSWDGVFDELINQKKLMSDPSILVTVPTHDDPELAPPGKNSYYVLFPTPNLDADIDWTRQAKPYRDQMIKTIEARGYEGFGDSIETEVVTTPLDWKNQGMEMGAPFAS